MEKMFTAADFDTEVLGSDKPVLVDFFATWCGPCKMMAPAVEKLAEEYEGRAVIGKLDVEESMDIAGRYGVMNVPTLILFKDGRAVERKVGLQSASDLRKLLDSVLEARAVPLAFRASGRSLGGSNKAERAFRPVQAREEAVLHQKIRGRRPGFR